jgi:hypothetical protein
MGENTDFFGIARAIKYIPDQVQNGGDNTLSKSNKREYYHEKVRNRKGRREKRRECDEGETCCFVEYFCDLAMSSAYGKI